MVEEQSPPLILCLENMVGEEVALRIEPQDDFQTFIDKAKESKISILDGDINSITRNQPVSLTDNIYQYLLNSDHGLNTEMGLASQTLEQILEPNDGHNDLVYILDDGTQINASQIHFDNEDPPVDLTAEKIPFIQYAADYEEVEENVAEENTRKFNIIESPVSRWSSKNSSPKCSFVNSLPFKLVCTNTSGFEAQFTKYLEGEAAKTYTTLNPVTARNKSPRTIIRENYKNYDAYPTNADPVPTFSREDVLNMFKDSPVAANPYENVMEKRKHVRKTDPSRLVFKKHDKKPISYIDVDGTLVSQSESQNCFICTKFVENNAEKLYLFDVEDQKLHRASPLKKQSTQLKIICEDCLDYNFKPCKTKGSNQTLNHDEYLVIRNNQQYIFQQTRPLNFPKNMPGGFVEYGAANVQNNATTGPKHMGGSGKFTGKPLNEDPNDVVLVKDEKGNSSDVEIIENPEPDIDDSVIENLDDADEDVKEFLGKYQEFSGDVELKCRFCTKQFADLSEVTEHGTEHKHNLEDGEVYPCPLCDYGYANFIWLKGHLKAAHEKSTKSSTNPSEGQKDDKLKDSESIRSSPIAKRTRSSDVTRTEETDAPEKTPDADLLTPKKEKDVCGNVSENGPLIIKTEVKQETVDTSDEEAIWIVQTADGDSDINEDQVRDLLSKAKGSKERVGPVSRKNHCDSCSQIFPSSAKLALHKCARRRGRKRKYIPKEDTIICIPSEEDFIKRAHNGRPRYSNIKVESDKPRKTKGREPSSDPQIVTCHNCNESFTSKVRLKFHMQFHDKNEMTTTDGHYRCPECSPRSVFATESELFDHVHFQHHKQRRWQCVVDGCGKTFYLRANLTKHSRIHTDTRRYVCPTCGKRFLDKQTLDEHSVTHLQIKPYQCHICMKQLTRRSRLRMHLRAHEEQLSPKHVLACAVCARAFKNNIEAEEHARSSAACVDKFVATLKLESEDLQLSPGSGLVRRPDLDSLPDEPISGQRTIARQVDDQLAAEMLAAVADEARAITRVVEIEKAFRCEYCEDVYYTEDGLNDHRVIHKGVKNPFICHICKVSFATYSRCTTHKTTHGYYKRPLQDAKTSPRAADTPAPPSAAGILGYGGFPTAKHFLCEDCGRSYLHWTYLQVHRRMKHANDNFVYTCNLCNVSFPNSWSIAYHKKKLHGDVQDECITTKVARENYRIPCRDCDEVLPNKTALYKHRKNKHSDSSLKCGTPSPSTLWCPVCAKRFASRAALDAHALAHISPAHAAPATPATPAATCDHCRRTFISGAALAAHKQDCHEAACPAPRCPRPPPRRPYTCHHCGHAFRTVSMRNEHLRIHTGERPFPCDVCGLAFRRSTAMRNHRLIHSGIRAWACPRCAKRFRIRSDLRTHIRLKHPERILVLEVAGLEPSPDQVLGLLNTHNIAPEKVLDISKITFTKGSSSIIPCTERTLSLLSGLPRTNVNWTSSGRVNNTPSVSPSLDELLQPARRGRGIAKHPRRPKILQRGDSTAQYAASTAQYATSAAQYATSAAEYATSIDPAELSLDVQMLLRDRLSGENRTSSLGLDDALLN